MSRRFQVCLALCALAVAFAAMPRGNAAAQGARSGGAAAPAGTITGRIKFEGTAPRARVVRMDSDPVCMKEGGAATSDVLLVGAGNALQNVFVYVKDGLGAYVFDTPTETAKIDQKDCRYHPHVFGMMVGQPIQILNSDPTLHNVHAVPKTNKEFNFGQPKEGMQTSRVFDKPEVMVPFRCDVHGWMSAYAGVLPHPFFAVSKADGSFEIKGLPAGTYTIEAWHERLGVQTQKVTLDGGAGATVSFAFKNRA